MRTTRLLAVRAAVAVGLAAVTVTLVAGMASAHVTVSADDATQGGYAKLTFRVPDESDSADTTKVAVFFPGSQPLAEVSVQPLPGWSYQVKTVRLAQPISSDDGQVTEAVSQVVWTADSKASAIGPGEFEEFDVSAGPLPKAPTMVFKALQTYSDGSVVRWIDEAVPGQPEHPAPTLTLSAATADAAHDTSGGGSGRATLALVLSVAALVVALGAAASAVVRRRS